MANGSRKPIKDVRLGDKVIATDKRTGRTEAKPVTALHNNHDRDLADVTIKDTRTGKTTTLHTTWHHPFWNATTRQWTDAADLKAGDRLRDANGQATQIVAAIKIWTGLKWMRDLTVANIHTYYVVAGETQHGGQMYAGDAANCAEIRACNLLIANHGAAFEEAVGRPLTLSDIEFITLRSSTGVPEPACLSCQSVLVRNGATDLSR